jgi:DNA end-binding protein Ku
MSARATWKGLLKISLVTIPIKVYPATESSEGLAFHQLHARCQTRIRQRKWCVACALEPANADIVKGYEFAQGQFVIVQPEEFDAVQPLSTKVIDLTRFAHADALDPIAFDRAYYLAPDGPVAAAAYAVLRDSMAGVVGIGKLAIYGREYLVAVRPRTGILLLHTLHHAAEIRPIDAIEDLAAVGPPVRAGAEVTLARQVIAACTGPLTLADFTDQYHVDLRRLIDAKIAGDEIVVPPTPARPPVVNLQDALRASLVAVRAAKKTPAKVSAGATRQRA